jgi:general secretion pathway protein K
MGASMDRHACLGKLAEGTSCNILNAQECSAESGRIDLNFAPKELLAGLSVAIGAPQEDALRFADRILAWRTPLTFGATDREAPIYQAAGKPYRPCHGPFQHVNEVGMLIGLPTRLIDRALPDLTVESGQADRHERPAW